MTSRFDELNKFIGEIMTQEYNNLVKPKGTSTYYIKGKVGNKKVCFTLSRTGHNGRFGFWSWVQTHYKNGKIKRTKFALSGSKAKAEARAEKLLERLER